MKEVEKKEKSGEIVKLLKDTLNDIFVSFDMNLTDKGEDILKKLANDERMVKYNNLFFKAGILTISNYDFLKRFGTLYDLFLDLVKQ